MRLSALAFAMSVLSGFPAQAGHYKDVEYARAGEVNLRMDIQTADGQGLAPAVILVHGGGWIRGDRVWNVSPLFDPLHEAGYAWFSISYRPATDFLNFGVAVEDVRAAIHYVRDNAARYGVDPDRIVVIGESAGAHLASLAALAEPKLLAGVVSLYGPMNLEHLARTSPVVPAQVRDALQNSAFGPLLSSHLQSLSPAARVVAGAPPFLLIHGTADGVVPLDQSTEMQKKLKAVGVVCDLITVPGGGHGMRHWGRSPEQAAWKKQLVAWL
ncbi:MAG TPA: alpha/beta hydrolase, partial [Bryobacteraceae bacterium]|nr:alpha/beta hydrolase [Bryobacteraceae bacterium]